MSSPQLSPNDVIPISLPASNYVVEMASMVFISGYGSTEKSDGEASEDLLYTYIPITNNTECAILYKFAGRINTTAQFCAGQKGRVSF